MTKRLLIALFAATLIAPLPSALALSASAQEPAPPAPAPPPAPSAPPAAKPVPPPPPPAPAPGQPNANVQLDVVVTDTVSGKPEAKRVTLLLRNNRAGQLRTEGQIWVDGQLWAVELAFDGRVNIVAPGLIEAMVTFNYAAPPIGSITSGEEAGRGLTPPAHRQLSPPAKVQESLSAVLRTGQPMLVSRSADPVTNRTVTVELTATIREP